MKIVRFKGENIIYDTIKEAEDHGIIVDLGSWKTAMVGSWVRTDEDPPRVLCVLKEGKFGKSRLIQTCCGTYKAYKNVKLDSIPRQNRYSITGKPHGAGTKLSKKQREMVKVFTRGETAFNIKKSFIKVYRREPGMHEIKMYGRSWKFWEAVKMELKEDMESLGLDRTFFLQKIRDAIESPKSAPKDVFKMAKDGLELLENRAEGSRALFAGFAVQSTEFKEIEGEKIKALPDVSAS